MRDYQAGMAAPNGPLGRSEAPGSALVSISGLIVDFVTPSGTTRALHDVSLDIGRGEILGLVGESGSGKSVTSLALLGLVPAPGRVVAGHIVFDGLNLLDLPARSLAALRGRRMAFISQTPRAALNPSFRIADQIGATLAACAPAVAPRDRMSRAHELLATMGFDDPARVLASYPHQLSGGMCQRVCIAMALAGAPDLLIADEPTTALDVAVQMQILAQFHRLRRDTGVSILLVSHDLALVRAIADRVVVLYGGEVQETGSVDGLLERPLHPYSRALLSCMPDPSRRVGRLASIDGQPSPVTPDARGCRFAPRCAEATDLCSSERPNLRALGGARVRCHHVAHAGATS